MGMTTSAYHFYGVHIPESQWTGSYAGEEGELLDRAIKTVRNVAPDVLHLSAGEYDQDMLFLLIYEEGFRVVPGEFRLITDRNAKNLRWNDQLFAVMDAMGYEREEIGEPGWITVPDVG